MGKMKQKRFKQHKPEPTGLPSVREFEARAEMDAGDQSRVSNTVSSAIDKLQSPSPEERECACLTITSLAAQSGTIPEMIRGDMVKHMAPLIVDPALSVRLSALGSLRNVSVDGGCQVCETMVAQDVLTPLVALIKQYGSNWAPENISENQKDQELKLNTYLQAVHLMWNLCESSETAVKIFNQNGLLMDILPCLQADVYGTDLAIAVGQLLYTVTEDNVEASTLLGQEAVLAGLQLLVTNNHQSTEQLLLRILAAGILYNITRGNLGSAAGSMVTSVVMVLGEVLQQDLSVQLGSIAELLKHISDAKDTSENGEDHKMAFEPMEVQNKNLDSAAQSLDQILTAQQMALELLANLCFATEEEEVDWEDLSAEDSEGSEEITSDEHVEDPSCSLMSPLCVPSEVHGAFVAAGIVSKVLSKCDSPNQHLGEILGSHMKGKRILKSLLSVQTRALLCISNLTNALEADILGGPDVLHNVWDNLSHLTSSPNVVQNKELLEAVTGAMRAVAQKLKEINSPKLSEVTAADMQILFGMGHQCPHAEVRASIIRIISIVGCVLAKHSTPNPLLRDIGVFLLVIVSKDLELWLIAEALDAIFDVFAEDHLNSIAEEIGLIEKLKVLVPVLKTKVKQQKKMLGAHMPIISTARTNLVRFIQYKSHKC